jgi:uncharacterized membrane protein
MLVGTKLRAFGHLLAISDLHDAVLFGSFLIRIIAMARSRGNASVCPA